MAKKKNGKKGLLTTAKVHLLKYTLNFHLSQARWVQQTNNTVPQNCKKLGYHNKIAKKLSYLGGINVGSKNTQLGAKLCYDMGGND